MHALGLHLPRIRGQAGGVEVKPQETPAQASRRISRQSFDDLWWGFKKPELIEPRRVERRPEAEDAGGGVEGIQDEVGRGTPTRAEARNPGSGVVLDPRAPRISELAARSDADGAGLRPGRMA